MKLIPKSIVAGIFIAIAATVYLNCPITVVGALLFSIGLIMVFEYNASLFTGFVGGARTFEDIGKSALILAGNTLGCAAIAAINATPAIDLWSRKLATPLWLLFGRGVMCGMLIEFCAHQNKKHQKLTSIGSCLIAIPAFILGGAEHSIADICYMMSRRDFSVESFVVIAVVALGNALGAQLLNRFEKLTSQ